jgi:hypothetical protein
MMARQQLARVVPLAALILVAAAGLRGVVASPRWDGPLKAHGAIVGIAVEGALAALLAATIYRDHLARRREEARLRAESAARAMRGATPGPRATTAADDGPDVARTLRLHLLVLLGLAMAAVAVVLLANLHLHMFGSVPARPRLPGLPSHSGPSGSPPRRARLPGHGFPLGAIAHWLLYGLLIAATLAALIFSVWWRRRRPVAARAPHGGGYGLYSFPAEPEELREAVVSGRAAMAGLDEARAAIIACYEAMERSLADRGAARGLSGTPDELLGRATQQQIVRGTGVRRLTTLFYEARFSSHPLGPAERNAAIQALDDLAADLGAVAAEARHAARAGDGAAGSPGACGPDTRS